MHAGNRRSLVDEIRKGHFDAAFLGLELFDHLRQHDLEGLHRDLALVRVQDRNEPRHVGALEVLGQADVHVENGDRVLRAAAGLLDPDRVADRLDADLVDGQAPGVGGTLDVGNGRRNARVAGIHPHIISAD